MRQNPTLVLIAILGSIAALAAACTSPTSQISDPAESAEGIDGSASGAVDVEPTIAEIAGTEITATRVVPLTCIPSRTDPVGTWVGIRVVTTTLDEDVFRIGLESTDARFGSHPSGCTSPELMLAQSVFLLRGEDESVLPASVFTIDDVLTLEFELAGRLPRELDVMIAPTIAFITGEGERQTTLFGIVGRYPLRHE